MGVFLCLKIFMRKKVGFMGFMGFMDLKNYHYI